MEAALKERNKSLPPKLALVSKDISEALKEAKKIKELTVQEEVVIELDKVDAVLEQAKKEIARIMQVQ